MDGRFLLTAAALLLDGNATAGGDCRSVPLDVRPLVDEWTTLQADGTLTTTYQAGSGFGGNHTAFGKKLHPPGCFPGEEIELAYEFKPEPGFDWARGGKLPGLWIGHGKASGYQHSASAASARLMWKQGGELIGYLYTMNGTNNPALEHHNKVIDEGASHGDAVFKGQGLQLRAGEWNSLRVRVKLNTIDARG